MRKESSIHYRRLLLFLMLCILTAGAALSGEASAQGTQLNQSQLVDLVAPVALYPDALLTNVLTASTVPDQVIQANQYVKTMGGKVTSMPDNDWDPSVKGLLYFPDVLGKMNNDLSWTRNLGNAVVNQMSGVLSAVQTFRSQAVSAGNLQSTSQQKVVTGQNTIEIIPTNPEVIYVPQYSPTQVVNQGHPLLAFATGVAVSDWWHCNNVDWAARNITVNPVYVSHYNYRPGGYYYNTIVPRPGYQAPRVWNPAPPPAGVRNYGGASVRSIDTVNVNRNVDVNRVGGRTTTGQINSQLQQGLRNTRVTDTQCNRTGGGFGNMNNGSGVRQESARGAASRNSFERSSVNVNRSVERSGSVNRSFGGGQRRR